MNGVIWNKVKKDFVPISSVPVFAIMQQERFRQSRAMETHNFRLQNLTLTSFEQPAFLEFYDNNMKVTGLCGELWNLLSDKLNFTLQPVRSNESGMGIVQNNDVAKGLLRVILHNETIAIPKIEMYTVLSFISDFTMPLWMNSQRLYIRNEVVHNSTWMAKVFSWKIWCCILIMHLLLSLCSFWTQNVLERIKNSSRASSINDHIFYNFGMICNQCHVPRILIGRSKIVDISVGFFCSIIYIAFGALLFVYMFQKINIPPFKNLETLLSETTYSVVNLKDSLTDVAFKVISEKPFIGLNKSNRIIISSTVEEMFKLACMEDKQKYTIFQGEDDYKARTKNEKKCHMSPIGESYLKTWIASGIVKNFKYKRTIDLGILRIKEVGLWDALTSRWLIEKYQQKDISTAEPIGMDQVILIILIMGSGVIIAFIIFIIEKIAYKYKFGHNNFLL
ncbi:uncharacterized protein LOC120359818 [Solenopsis invicta]|uniref:uncharacterized protein LOC120359818 n=1 Tax=Solenopsis invicta TaxID=13686 RepID=UPI00193D42AC|nr:uncharacterized protein LOC120359818 [Solenopsis invicta]